MSEAMSEKFRVSEDVKLLITNIIEKYNLNPLTDVKYEPGSEVGDGYVSQAIAVKITNSRETLDLFLKCALAIQSTESFPMEKFYANEAYFYEVIYPTFRKFSKDRGNKDGFSNVPRCYGTLKNNIIAMENLKKKGFKLFERNQIMNDDHIELVLKIFARFHAISFCFKDQKKEDYEEFVRNTCDAWTIKNGESPLIKMLRGTVKDFLRRLDPVVDREILNKCNVEDLVSFASSADRNLNEYSILTQGDCWCNNMMFLYEKEDMKTPIDMVLIDWQLLRPASPVFDLSYFYLTIASEEKLARTEDYLQLYHDELSQQIRKLGSDPEVLYPFRILLKEWGQHCGFGFTMATIIIKAMLSEKDEAFNLEKLDFEDTEQLENLYPKFENEGEFLKRMRNLAKYMIRNGYL